MRIIEMTRRFDSIITRLPHVPRTMAAAIVAAGLAACSDSPLGPDEQHASMEVSAAATTATTIGESLTIGAAVMNSRGVPIANAGIHWDLSVPGVLESLGNGKFRVLSEGTVQIGAVW